MYPKEVAAFEEWAKAMVKGANVERPKWKTAVKGGITSRRKRGKRFRRRKRRSSEE